MCSDKWAVIFDVDGTMVDNSACHRDAWLEFGKRNGFDITEEYYNSYIHSRSNERIMRRLCGDDVEHDKAWAMSMEKEVLYRQMYAPVMKEIGGLGELLQQLKTAGVMIAAASNSQKDNVDFVIDGLDLREYFDVIVHRDMVKIGKPDPTLFLMAVDKLGIDKSRCIIVEDSISGFRAADNAGMGYVVVTEGADAEELKHAGSARAVYVNHTEITVEKLRELVRSREKKV
jgi:HAD superfamily hydrolase (TIGR01509 family)